MARELVYTGFMSLDGVVDSPGSASEGHRSGGWVMDTEFLPEAFAPTWRESEDHAAYQDFPKYVVSTTLTDADLYDGWGPTTILRSTDDVVSLKRQLRLRESESYSNGVTKLVYDVVY